MGMVSERPVIKLGQRANAALNARPNCRRPEHSMLAKLRSAFTALGKKLLHLCVRCAGKEKQLVKVALPRQLCLPHRQARVLHEFPKRKRAQRHYGDACLLRKRLKRISRPLCLRDRVITSGRRWEKHGVLQTILLIWRLRMAYFFGADPKRLARHYGYG